MAVTAENPAPYAPASAIIDIIDRYRNRGLPRPITAEVLGRAGVSDSLIPRTAQALATLELIDEAGNPTETLEGLRRAPEAEFKPLMANWLKSVYGDVLNFADANDDETAIRDAFRNYNPVGQQPRMVSLFMGLCRAAGIRSDEQSTAAARPRARKAPAAGASAPRPRVDKQPPARGAMPSGIPAPIAGLLTKLPPEHGSWTQAERERFESAFKALLDFSFVIAEKSAREAEDE